MSKKSICDELMDLCEMGRPRQEMKDLLDALGETLIEHLWKVFAYSKHRPRSVKKWLQSLNKHLPKLRRFNIKRGVEGFNYNKEQLRDQFFSGVMFESKADIDLLVAEWSSEGFPKVSVSEKDRKRLMKLADKYVDLILSKGGKKFTVTDDELL